MVRGSGCPQRSCIIMKAHALTLSHKEREQEGRIAARARLPHHNPGSAQIV